MTVPAFVLPVVCTLLAGGAAFAAGRLWERRRQPPRRVPDGMPCFIPDRPGDALSCEERQSLLVRQVSHALRNPLAGILMSAELLLEEEDKHQIQKSLSRILEQGYQIRDLVARLQRAMTIQACQFRLELEALHLAVVVRRVVQVHQGRAAIKGQRLTVAEPLWDGRVVADRAFLEGILQELLDNAVKFSPKDSDIQIGCADSGNGIRLWVQDGGQGIALEDRPLLFTAFGRLRSIPTAGEPCLGLGLWTARNMAWTLGGDLMLTPSETGARFELELLEAVKGH